MRKKIDKKIAFDSKNYFKDKKFIACKLANDICFDEPGISNKQFIVTKDNQEIWRYNGSFYEQNGEQFIKAEAQEIIGEICTITMKNNVVSCIKDNKDLWIDRNEFNNNKNLINLKNGIYNIETGEFIKHGPGHIFNYEVPVEYGPNTDCPKIMKFLEEILNSEDIPIIQELFGYCLYPRYHIHKAFMFIGDGANGKSTLLRLLIELLGKNNISSVPLQVLGKDKFAAYDLHGKLANICADIPNAALGNTGLFKMITGEDNIRGEKKFQDAFGFTSHAKLIFSANQLPPSPTDQSDAFFRRWIPINFPNRFIGSKCDTDIITKITKFPELNGLLNWALKGLKRLLKNEEFSKYTSIDEVREYWNKASDIVAEFIHENVEEDANGIITKEEVYNQYKQFIRGKRYPTIANNVFSQRFKKAISFKIEEGQQHGGKKTWKGIRWKWKDSGQNGQLEL